MSNFDHLQSHVDSSPHPLIFATVSGAHLYGFPSPDSDFDLRGVHVLPIETVVGLDDGEQTIAHKFIDAGREIDLVTHDVGKFFAMVLKRNGYVLEQIFSPLVVHTTPAHDELKSIATGCVTRHHAHHYLGFAATQWRLWLKDSPPRVKPLLYVYRVLLTGIHLMRTGRIESNLSLLNEDFGLTFIDDLIAQKRTGPEKGPIDGPGPAFHTTQYEQLTVRLRETQAATRLPDAPTTRPALNDLLVHLRTTHPNKSD